MLSRLPQLAQDKANHLIYGLIASLAAAVLAHATGHDPRTAALVTAAGLGLGKEVIDWASGKGTPDVLDAVATASGCVPLIVGYCLAAGWA